MNTFHGRFGADNTFTVWVRAGDAKYSFTGKTPSVDVFAYGYASPIDTLTATSAEAGKVDFSISAEETEKTFGPGLYRLSVKADTVEVWAGLLRIV